MIPPITNPMGRHWRQPPREAIELEGVTAKMSQETFEKLSDYSGSRPTGMYAGKMWKECCRGVWVLRWTSDSTVPDMVDIHWAWIVVPTVDDGLRESVETHLL